MIANARNDKYMIYAGGQLLPADTAIMGPTLMYTDNVDTEKLPDAVLYKKLEYMNNNSVVINPDGSQTPYSDFYGKSKERY